MSEKINIPESAKLNVQIQWQYFYPNPGTTRGQHSFEKYNYLQLCMVMKPCYKYSHRL